MNSQQIPGLNPAFCLTLINLGLLREPSSQEELKASKTNVRQIVSWSLEYLGCTLFGWYVLNLVAIYGSKAARPVTVPHNDWAMQTNDGVVNFTILVLIFVGQIFIFMVRRISSKETEDSFKKGKFFAVPLVLIIIGFVALLLRFNQIETIEYPLYIPNPLVFSVLWIIVSSVVFTGHLGLWKYILVGIIKGKKD